MMVGWKEYKLKDFCDFKYGKSLPDHKRKNGQYPVYGSSDIVAYHDTYFVKGPGIIIGRKGTVGKVQYTKENYCPIDTTFYVEEDKSKVDLKYLYYRIQLCGLNSMNSDAAVPGLNRTVAMSQVINLPPLPIQRKISTILSAYDDLIENNLKRIKLLEEMAQKTYEEWFVKFRIDGVQLPINKETGLPAGWEQRKLECLCSKITDGTHDTPKQTTNGIKLITGKHILNGFIDFESAYTISESDHLAIKKRSGLEKGDILFSNIGTLGNIAFVNQDFEFSCKNVFIFKQKKGFTNFLYTYLSSENIKQKLSNQSSGVAQKFYSLKFIRDLTDFLPTDDLIKKFDNYISPIYKLKYKLDNQNQKLKEARNILLPRLMTGMIDVEKM